MKRTLWAGAVLVALVLLGALLAPRPSALPEQRPPGLRLEYRTRFPAGGTGELRIVLADAECSCRFAGEPSTAKGFAFQIEPTRLDELWQLLRRRRIDRFEYGNMVQGGTLQLAWDANRIEVPPGGAWTSPAWSDEWREVTNAFDLLAETEAQKRRVEVPVLFGPGLSGAFLAVIVDGAPVVDHLATVPSMNFLRESRTTAQVLPGTSRIAVRLLTRYDPKRTAGEYGEDDFSVAECLLDLRPGIALRLDATGPSVRIEAGPEPVAPRDSEARLEAADRAVADEFAAYGDALDRRGLHGRALRAFERAIALAPDHEAARVRLGHMRAEGGWRPDPGADVERTDRGEDDSRKAALEAIEPRVRALSDRAAAAYAEAAGAARDAKREDLAARAWSRVLDHAPDHEAARRALGYSGTTDSWFRPPEQARRDEIAAALHAAEGRDPSPHFAISGGSMIPEQGTHALAVRDLFLRWFEVPGSRELFPAPMRIEMFGRQEEWDRFVETTYPEENWEFARQRIGAVLLYENGPRLVGRTFNADRGWKLDLTVHDVAHALLHFHQGGKESPLWLNEGVAYVFQLGLLGTASNYCIPGEPTAEDAAWDLAPPQTWRARIRASVVDGTTPSIREVVGSRVESMSSAARIKTYSLCDHLLAERRKELRDFLARLAAGEDHDAALAAAFHISSQDELDRAWREWVLANY